jgi:hypothetical protein
LQRIWKRIHDQYSLPWIIRAEPRGAPQLGEMNSDKDNKAGFKQVDLTGAKVAGQLSLAGASVDGVLNANLLQVSGSLFMNSAGLKEVDLVHAKVAGQLSLKYGGCG